MNDTEFLAAYAKRAAPKCGWPTLEGYVRHIQVSSAALHLIGQNSVTDLPSVIAACLCREWLREWLAERGGYSLTHPAGRPVCVTIVGADGEEGYCWGDTEGEALLAAMEAPHA